MNTGEITHILGNQKRPNPPKAYVMIKFYKCLNALVLGGNLTNSDPLYQTVHKFEL